MLHYIDAFPERFHHPKEDAYLFRRLRERDPSAGELLDRLETEHEEGDRKSTRLNSSHVSISYAVFCLKKKTKFQLFWGGNIPAARGIHCLGLCCRYLCYLPGQQYCCGCSRLLICVSPYSQH